MTSDVLHAAPRVWMLVAALGFLATVPVLVAGFRRRGTGAVYEQSFVTQSLPRVVLLIGSISLAAAFRAMTWEGGQAGIGLRHVLSVADLLPSVWIDALSWTGLALSLSGAIFIAGGWYSLGRHFSPDVEVFDDHVLYDGGLFRLVMHPAYSGFIQFFVGSALVALSPLTLALALGLGLPLALYRAQREERILEQRFGTRYTAFAERRQWRRIVPTFVPFGF